MAIPKSLANAIYEKHVAKMAKNGAPVANSVACHSGKDGEVGKKPSKYRNVKTEVDGKVFDSKKEALRYQELIMLENGGLIRDLKCQPRYPLAINGEVVAHYVADFSYKQSGKVVIEDVKSSATKKLATYRLKKKMFEACYRGLVVTEV